MARGVGQLKLHSHLKSHQITTKITNLNGENCVLASVNVPELEARRTKLNERTKTLRSPSALTTAPTLATLSRPPQSHSASNSTLASIGLTNVSPQLLPWLAHDDNDDSENQEKSAAKCQRPPTPRASSSRLPWPHPGLSGIRSPENNDNSLLPPFSLSKSETMNG